MRNAIEQFEALVQEYYASLYRFAFSLTRAEAEAMDLTQQTYLTWARKGHQLRDLTRVKGWLYTTLHRTFLSTRRRQSRHPEECLDAIAEDCPELTTHLDMELDASSIGTALAQLPSEHRAAVALFYLEGYSYRELALILEVPIGTVKSRVARGIGRLRSFLVSEPTNPGPEDLRATRFGQSAKSFHLHHFAVAAGAG